MGRAATRECILSGLVSAQKGAQKTKRYQKTPLDRAAQDQVKRKHRGVGKEDRNWRHDPPWYRQGPGRRSRPAGRRSGSRNSGGRKEPRRANPQGLKGTLATSTKVKGGRPDGGRGGRNEIAEQGCRIRQGPGEKVEGGKKASAGTGSGGRLDWTLGQVDRRYKTGRGGRIG